MIWTPTSGDFNALGVSGTWTGHPFARHRTDRHTLGQTEGQGGRHKKGMTRREKKSGQEVGKGTEHGSSLIPGIIASVQVMLGTWSSACMHQGTEGWGQRQGSWPTPAPRSDLV